MITRNFLYVFLFSNHLKMTHRVLSSGLYCERAVRLSRSSCTTAIVLSINVFVIVVMLDGDEDDGSIGDISRRFFGIEFDPSEKAVFNCCLSRIFSA